MNNRPTRLLVEFDETRKIWMVTDPSGQPLQLSSLIGIFSEVNASLQAALTVHAFAQHQEQLRQAAQAQALFGKKITH